MKIRTLTHEDIPETYAELVWLFMPRPLHDEVDYRNAVSSRKPPWLPLSCGR